MRKNGDEYVYLMWLRSFPNSIYRLLDSQLLS